MTGAAEQSGSTAPAVRHIPRILPVLLVVTVLGQRLALPLPGFQLQVTLVAALLAVALLLWQGQVRPDPLRLQLYLIGATACATAAFVASYLSSWTGGGGSLSLPSLLVLLVLYLPWVYKLRDVAPAAYRDFALSFVRLMVVVAAVGAVQFLAQYLGLWSYRDVLGSLVPSAFLVSGYNVDIPLQYGAAVHKSNAFVFLEPSFLSQFCGLAIIIAVVLRAPIWQLVVLGLGLLSAVSGTGLLLIGVGTALAVLRVPSVIRPGLVVAGAVGGAFALLLPVAQLLLARRGEFVQSGSSGYKRFVAPYIEVGQGLAQEPVRYLLGGGPGTATRLLESSARGQVGDAIVYNIPTKLVFEYGLVAGMLFTAFILVALLHRGPVPVVPGSLVFMLFFLSGSLLQPHTVVLAWLLTALWTGSPWRRPARPAWPASADARVNEAASA